MTCNGASFDINEELRLVQPILPTCHQMKVVVCSGAVDAVGISMG